jgi:hypothetical protein
VVTGSPALVDARGRIVWLCLPHFLETTWRTGGGEPVLTEGMIAEVERLIHRRR